MNGRLGIQSKFKEQATVRVGGQARGTLDKGSQYSLRVDPQPLHARDQSRALDVHAGCRTVRARDSPVRHFEEADNLIALICFARACHRGMSAIVAQLSNRSLQGCPTREDY
jgi:hypothetical protein